MRKNQARQSRRNHRKTGSIMIMVVALLVLMALLGTAYIATARHDRGSAVQNSNNVQIDMFLESVENFCKTAVAGDLFDGNGNYRPIPRDPYSPISTQDVNALTGALIEALQGQDATLDSLLNTITECPSFV